MAKYGFERLRSKWRIFNNSNAFVTVATVYDADVAQRIVDLLNGKADI